MTSVLNIILLIMAGLSMAVAVYLMVAGFRYRSVASGSPYGVKRQEAHQRAIVSFMRSIFLVSFSLIIFATLGISNLPASKELENNKSVTPDLLLSPTMPVKQPTESSTPRQLVGSPTSPVATLTSSPTLTPMPTDTPIVIIAVVNSPNGLWLREKPGGIQQLELIADQSEIIVLEGTDIAEGFEWRRVRTQSGQEGWVAVEFIVFP
ncbi:MAG TPA: hypothetical protein VMZ24_07290 [Patescibacteria group bacterium]|nr:hypothetical protein [Patescibacteria group bacterium]